MCVSCPRCGCHGRPCLPSCIAHPRLLLPTGAGVAWTPTSDLSCYCLCCLLTLPPHHTHNPPTHPPHTPPPHPPRPPALLWVTSCCSSTRWRCTQAAPCCMSPTTRAPPAHSGHPVPSWTGHPRHREGCYPCTSCTPAPAAPQPPAAAAAARGAAALPRRRLGAGMLAGLGRSPALCSHLVTV